MIRKQLYLGREHEEKLRRLAARWGCTEAEVVRAALDRLPDDLESAIDARLNAAGVLAPPPEDAEMTDDELAALEAEVEAWLDSLPGPLGLSEAVLEDRR